MRGFLLTQNRRHHCFQRLKLMQKKSLAERTANEWNIYAARPRMATTGMTTRPVPRDSKANRSCRWCDVPRSEITRVSTKRCGLNTSKSAPPLATHFANSNWVARVTFTGVSRTVQRRLSAGYAGGFDEKKRAPLSTTSGGPSRLISGYDHGSARPSRALCARWTPTPTD
jgi:hypothetical protein